MNKLTLSILFLFVLNISFGQNTGQNAVTDTLLNQNANQIIENGRIATYGNDTTHYENEEILAYKKVSRVYTDMDSSHKLIYYGSYENSKDLAGLKFLGISVVLLLFSFYLFFVATKLYHQFFDKHLKERILNTLIYLGVSLMIICWVILAFSVKGIPMTFWISELIYFPNQFVFGVLLSSLLLLVIGIFRFSIIAFIYSPAAGENIKKDTRFSVVGFAFGLLSLLANLWTIWSAFK